MYNIIRGVDRSPVTPRMAIKSMLSAKSFRPPSLPRDFKAALAWVRLFVADIQGRIDEEDTVIIRRPKVMAITFTNKGGSRSKQMPLINTGGSIRESMDRTAEKLLREVTADGSGNVWPCIRLSIDVSNFEDREVGSRDIGTFFKRKRDLSSEPAGIAPITKRSKHPIFPPPPPPQPAGIASYFQNSPSTASALPSFASSSSSSIAKPLPSDPAHPPPLGIASYFPLSVPARSSSASSSSSATPVTEPKIQNEEREAANEYYIICPTCSLHIPHHEVEEHKDYHIAKAMEEEWRREEAAEREREKARANGKSGGGSAGSGNGRGKGRGKVKGDGGRGEKKRQMTLNFE